MKSGNERCSSIWVSSRSPWLVLGACVCIAVACATAPPPVRPWGLPPDTRIATLASNGVKYLVYAPPEIRVPFGQDTEVKWYSEEGPFTIQTLDSAPFGKIQVVQSTSSPPYTASAIVPHDTPRGTYRYAVGLFSVADKKLVLDPRCPPIIVGP
jgi:hypothetical protein